MRIDQIVVAAAPGDAVTGAALQYRSLLRRACRSDLFAQHIDPALQGDVHQLATFDDIAGASAGGGDGILLLHGSIGSPEVFSFVASRPERLVLVYHNVSPASAFAPYDPMFAALLESGRRDIGALAGRVTLALAFSHLSASELLDMGYRDVRVLPFLVDVEALARVHPDDDAGCTYDASGEREEGPMLLFIGQVLPHKCPERLVQMFHVLSTYLRPDARLVMLGASRSPAYAQRFDTFVREMNLPRLHLLGSVSEEAKVAFLREADAFVTASSHEGFCVPVVEAMAFGVPVVARACAAIPETVGDAGILLPADSGATLFAEAVAAVLDDDALRHDLTAKGTARLDAFRPEEARASFLREILTIA